MNHGGAKWLLLREAAAAVPLHPRHGFARLCIISTGLQKPAAVLPAVNTLHDYAFGLLCIPVRVHFPEAISRAEPFAHSNPKSRLLGADRSLREGFAIGADTDLTLREKMGEGKGIERRREWLSVRRCDPSSGRLIGLLRRLLACNSPPDRTVGPSWPAP